MTSLATLYDFKGASDREARVALSCALRTVVMGQSPDNWHWDQAYGAGWGLHDALWTSPQGFLPQTNNLCGFGFSHSLLRDSTKRFPEHRMCMSLPLLSPILFQTNSPSCPIQAVG